MPRMTASTSPESAATSSSGRSGVTRSTPAESRSRLLASVSKRRGGCSPCARGCARSRTRSRVAARSRRARGRLRAGRGLRARAASVSGLRSSRALRERPELEEAKTALGEHELAAREQSQDDVDDRGVPLLATMLLQLGDDLACLERLAVELT